MHATLVGFHPMSFEISDNLTASVQFTYSKVQATNQIAQVPMTAEPSAGPQWQIPVSKDSTGVHPSSSFILVESIAYLKS